MLIGALALWVLYRRVRRNIGRQPLNARRMGGRIVLLAVIAVLMASGATHDVELLGALLAGAAAQADRNPFAAYQKSPLTLAILGVVIGYYLLYYAGVLNRSRALRAPT